MRQDNGLRGGQIALLDKITDDVVLRWGEIGKPASQLPNPSVGFSSALPSCSAAVGTSVCSCTARLAESLRARVKVSPAILLNVVSAEAACRISVFLKSVFFSTDSPRARICFAVTPALLSVALSAVLS